MSFVKKVVKRLTNFNTQNNDNKNSFKDDKNEDLFEYESDLDSVPPISQFKEHVWENVPSQLISHQSVIKNRRNFGGKGEYIEGKWENNNRQLLEIYSFQIIDPNNDNKTIYVRQQTAGYLFTFDEEEFIAKVYFDNINSLDFSRPFTNVKRSILKKIKIIEIIRDKLQDNLNDTHEKFKEFLSDRSRKTTENSEYAEDFFQISLKYNKWKSYDNISLLSDIYKAENISNDLKENARSLIKKLKTVKGRKLFSHDKYTINVLGDLYKAYENAVDNHKNILYDKYNESIYGRASSALKDNLESLSDEFILCISIEDITLFTDLINLMDKQPFTNIVIKSWDGLFKRTANIRKNLKETSSLRQRSLKQFVPLTHPIYFYLCKSFQELALEICKITDISINVLIKTFYHDDQNLINWPTTNTPIWFNCLKEQFYFILTLIEHFEPGNYSTDKKFEYNNINETTCEHLKNLFLNNDIPEKRLVWMYILNEGIRDILFKNSSNAFEPLLKGYTDFLVNAQSDYYESFRILTYNTARYIAKTNDYLASFDSESDRITLDMQINSINRFTAQKNFDDFRSLIDVYNEYWSNRESIMENIPNKFPYGKFKKDLERIRQKLLNISNTVLGIEAKAQGFIKYFRTFNEFLQDLNAMEFDWFIKNNNNLTDTEILVSVNNDKKSYKVLDPEKYINKYEHEHEPHYIIEIIKDLLNSISVLLEQRAWPYGYDDNLIVNAASELLTAISKLFLYLKEQPDYVSFDTFKIESTKPFDAAIKNSSSYEDFNKRIEIIGKSFWYLRKQDEIDIEKALHLCKELNRDIETEILKNSYTKYLEKFNFYIKSTISMTYDEKIKFISEEVKEQLLHIKSTKIDEFENSLKREFAPKLLSGLGAIWSIQESKDITSTGKVLKPHCIQILCILRLLSIEKNSKGIDKQLSQVLTGQGKSVVLGLFSALLSLMGHEIRIACYSKYLAKRDQKDFEEFFKIFNIEKKIIYYTFEDMAEEILEPNVNGEKKCLRNLVTDRIIKHDMEQVGQIEQKDISNTILLIDEVDVFFCDQFYGNTYNPCTIINIPALDSIQEKIWEIVNEYNDKKNSDILTKINNFIDNEFKKKTKEFIEFNKFRFKPGTYKLLKTEDDALFQREYTNQLLLEEHIMKMIDTAINVASGSTTNSKFKINEDGNITCRKEDGSYSTSRYYDYNNIFNYFRLKEKNFDNTNNRNYGYFLIHCGNVSYANLPEKYPLILGVSGTLNDLNEEEKKAIKEYYNINNISFMPSFFGCSNLKFNKYNNFTVKNSEEEWFNSIFNQLNCNINSGLSVLVFFELDIQLNEFHKKYLDKFDRMNILTVNTNYCDKKIYIDEAGIKKTITLATKDMGRGVDFKSSLVVEANGGMHVIQTYFSIDIKEEAQIKGRTARKDNKGSYELIICKKHLISGGLAKENTSVDYDELNVAREKIMKVKGQKNAENIEKSKKFHEKTMDFFESFFKPLHNVTLSNIE